MVHDTDMCAMYDTNTYVRCKLMYVYAVCSAFGRLICAADCHVACIPNIGVAAIEPIHLGHILGTDNGHKQHATGLLHLIEVPRDHRNDVTLWQNIWTAINTAMLVLAVH